MLFRSVLGFILCAGVGRSDPQQSGDEPERTYQAGESWTEKPGDHRQVSHNASNMEPAKLLAIFVVDTSDRRIVIPDK